MCLELERRSPPRRRSSDPTRELESQLFPVLRLTPLLRRLFSSSPVLASPLTLPLSTLFSSARAGFLRVFGNVCVNRAAATPSLADSASSPRKHAYRIEDPC